MKTIYPNLPIYGNLNDVEIVCMLGWEDAYYEQIPNCLYNGFQNELRLAYEYGYKVGLTDQQRDWEGN